MTTSVLSSRVRMGGVVVVALIAAMSLAVFLQEGSRDAESLPADLPSNEEGLAVSARTPVFFGHQSVGSNILGGVPAVFATAGLEAPDIVESSSPPDTEAAFANAYIGQNGDPVGKFNDFAQMIRSGYGDWARVAFMKLCYLDVVEGTDVGAVFAEYKATMAQLEQEFPEVDFMHLTVPLTTEPDLKTKLKVAVGRGTDHRANNVKREQYNALIRAEYGGAGGLVDVAAMESTKPDGTRVTGEVDGSPYFALYDGYSSDPGHLNDAGAHVAAAGLLDVVGANLNG